MELKNDMGLRGRSQVGCMWLRSFKNFPLQYNWHVRARLPCHMIASATSLPGASLSPFLCGLPSRRQSFMQSLPFQKLRSWPEMAQRGGRRVAAGRGRLPESSKQHRRGKSAVPEAGTAEDGTDAFLHDPMFGMDERMKELLQQLPSSEASRFALHRNAEGAGLRPSASMRSGWLMTLAVSLPCDLGQACSAGTASLRAV